MRWHRRLLRKRGTRGSPSALSRLAFVLRLPPFPRRSLVPTHIYTHCIEVAFSIEIESLKAWDSNADGRSRDFCMAFFPFAFYSSAARIANVQHTTQYLLLPPLPDRALAIAL